MAQATIKLVNNEMMFGFYTTENKRSLALELLSYDLYEPAGSFDFPGLTGEAAAEACFDLTNNPSRSEERARLYGRKRSVSVGDIVEVDGDQYLCESFGWVKL